MYLVPTASPDELEAIQYIPSSLNRAAHASSDSFFVWWPRNGRFLYTAIQKPQFPPSLHRKSFIAAFLASLLKTCQSHMKSFWQLRDSPNVSLLPSPARDPCSSSLIASPAIIRTWKHNAPLRYVKHIPIE